MMMICESNEKCVKQISLANGLLIFSLFRNSFLITHLIYGILPSSLSNGVDWIIVWPIVRNELCFTPFDIKEWRFGLVNNTEKRLR